MEAMEQKLWRFSEPNKFGFVGELVGGDTFSPKMDHLVCFLAGTLALGTQNGCPQKHLEMAKILSKTCFEIYKTQTGLAPEIVYFNMLPGRKEDITIKPLDAHSLLRPEAFEAWFYLYRIVRNLCRPPLNLPSLNLDRRQDVSRVGMDGLSSNREACQG